MKSMTDIQLFLSELANKPHFSDDLTACVKSQPLDVQDAFLTKNSQVFCSAISTQTRYANETRVVELS